MRLLAAMALVLALAGCASRGEYGEAQALQAAGDLAAAVSLYETYLDSHQRSAARPRCGSWS